MGKKAVVHLHNGRLVGCKKEGNLNCAAAWMDLDSIIQSEVRQSEKDKYYMISPICGI